MSDALITTIILGGTIALFISDRMRLDVVAMMSLLALACSGVVSVPEALAGFSSPAMLMIAGLFVVGAALTSTGVADWLGKRLEGGAGQGEVRVTIAVMGVGALLSAFMSSTGTVAILLPVVGTIAQRRGIAPARLFMPLAFAAHLGSNLTLISTPPNLLVSDALREAGHEPFRFFSFFGPGVVVMAVGVAYMAWIGRRALPAGADRSGQHAPLTLADLASEYGLTGDLRALRIDAGSSLIGKSLAEANVRSVYEVTLIGIERRRNGRRESCRVVPGHVFAEGDEILVVGRELAVRKASEELALSPIEHAPGFPLAADESLAEVVIPRRSKLAGRSLRELKLRDKYRVTALGLRRTNGSVVSDALALRDVVLRSSDTLLVKGRLKYLQNLRGERADLVLVAEPDSEPGVLIDGRGAILAVSITAVMLVVMALGLLPNVLAVLLAAVAVVLAGCVRPAAIYSSVSWESVVLIACMIPLAGALETTGAMSWIVSQGERYLVGASPTLVLGLLVLATSMMGMVLSNTATAVLLAPLAVRVATAADLSPEPLLMGVAFASSAAFATPIASPVNVLVMGPGGYRFTDYVRVGLPLQLVVLAVTVLVVPLFWPF